MSQELQRFRYWWGKQTAKGSENTTPPYTGYVVAGDIELQRDLGAVAVSDGNKYPGQKRYLNTMAGGGSPAFLGLPGSVGSLLWLLHGAETFAAGTNEVQTVATTGTPTGGTFTLTIWDGTQSITTGTIAYNAAAAAVATAINTAMTAAGHTGTPVAGAGGPLPTGVTVTFSGTTTAARPFIAMVPDYSGLTGGTSPTVTVTRTTPGVRNKHTFVPSSTQGFWATFVRSVGTSVVQRHSFVDSLIGGFTLECSQAQKDLRLTTPLLSLNPFKVVSADPSAALPTGVDGRPLLFTEGTGTFTLGTGTSAAAVSGTQAVTFTANEDRNPSYGDDTVPYDFNVGTPSLALSTTFIFDSVGLAKWNELIYGTASPAVGTTPSRNLPPAGSYSYDLKQKDARGNVTGNELKVTVPSVSWDVPPAPAPNVSGGEANVTLGGALEPPGGATQPYQIELWNADAAYT